MSSCLFCHPVDIRVTKEEMINALLDVEFQPLLKYYRAVLKEDPEYLRFHGVSTSLRICAALKLRDYPDRPLLDGPEWCHCCVIEALEESVKRMDQKEVAEHPLSHQSQHGRSTMKRISAILSVGGLALCLGFMAPSAFSAARNTHMHSGTSHAMFNRSTIETVQGKVEDVYAPKAGKAGEVRLSLKTDHGTMPVLLGPASYVDKENVKVNKGDDISVTGSKVTMTKKAEIMATEIKKGNQTLDLRKSDGTPLWSAKATQGK